MNYSESSTYLSFHLNSQLLVCIKLQQKCHIKGKEGGKSIQILGFFLLNTFGRTRKLYICTTIIFEKS